MDRKFFMVLERWFTKLSSQNVIGSPCSQKHFLVKKKRKKENKNNSFWLIFVYTNLFFHRVYSKLRNEPREEGQMRLFSLDFFFFFF